MSREASIRAFLITAKTVLATVIGGAASALFPLIQGDTSLLFSSEGRVKLLHDAISGAVIAGIAYFLHSPRHQQVDSPKG